MNNKYKICAYIDTDDLVDASVSLYNNILMNEIIFYDFSFNHIVQITQADFCNLLLNNKLVRLTVKYKTIFLEISIDYQVSKIVITAIPNLKEWQNDLSIYIKCVVALCENFFLKEFFTEPFYSLPTYE